MAFTRTTPRCMPPFVRSKTRWAARSVSCRTCRGPKIRGGTIKDGKISVVAGEQVRFVLSGSDGDKTSISLPHPEIFDAVAPGDDLLIDDGRVRVRVTGLGADFIDAKIVTGGVVSNRKGVNVPSAVLNLSPLTEKDRADLAFGLELGVDWVALSFVQKPGDVIEARGLIGDRAGIMAKIEKPAALEQIDDIVRLSDAVMVARGDLGVEIPPRRRARPAEGADPCCRLVGKPVIVATQMLDSMVAAPTPTRAEVSDVATAIYDGADAVMLSAELATGQYPREAVAMMSSIIQSTERHKMYRSIIDASQPGEEKTAPHAVAAAAADLAAVIKASAIVAFTSSGTKPPASRANGRRSRSSPSRPIRGCPGSYACYGGLTACCRRMSRATRKWWVARPRPRSARACQTDQLHRRGRRCSLWRGRHHEQPACGADRLSAAWPERWAAPVSA